MDRKTREVEKRALKSPSAVHNMTASEGLRIYRELPNPLLSPGPELA
jgi:hypothetical protein